MEQLLVPCVICRHLLGKKMITINLIIELLTGSGILIFTALVCYVMYIIEEAIKKRNDDQKNK